MRLSETDRRLPVAEALPTLFEALRTARAAVLSAPPGSGKTTLVPLALAEHEPKGRIFVVTPRQVAARAAARRMAAMLGEAVGETVGYHVRWDRRVGQVTRVIVMTEGMLLRRLEADPELDGARTVILDEFHERSLDADTALGLLLDVRASLRPDLGLLVMSATLEAEAVSELLGGVPAIRADGRLHPVGVTHRSLAARPLADMRGFARGVAEATVEAMAAADGDALVFLPGIQAIRAVAGELETRVAATVQQLYGSMEPAEQDAVLQPRAGRRVILSTPIAQTSLTVEGIGIVVDSGWHRLTRFDPRAGADRLVTERISRAAAEQRAGRAGRLGPGHCWRMWSADEHAQLPARDAPEILRADLAGFVLRAECWGRGMSRSMALLDRPPAIALKRAEALLADLGALGDSGQLTALGRRMAALPVAPRRAAMLLEGAATGEGALAVWLAALLEVDTGVGPHVSERLREAANAPSGRPLRRVAADLARALDINNAKQPPRAEPETAGRLLARAYPERIARRRPGARERYACSDGGEVLVGENAQGVEWLVAAHWEPGPPRRARLVAPLDAGDVLAGRCGALHAVEHLGWDDQKEGVVAESRRMLGELLIDARPVRVSPEATQEMLCQAVQRRGLQVLPWNEAARSLQARIGSLRAWRGGDWPALDDAALSARLEEWLQPHLAGMTRLAELAELDLAALLRAQVPPEIAGNLDRWAPERVRVPSGHDVRLQYSGDAGPPVLAVKLQALFGLIETPRVDDGRVPVQIQLLSPAGRPLQVTQDLASFWRNGYPEVARELRGRYPKHPWPEDPLAAEASMGARRRGAP
jgi:ATP-dependent helicase HrpB